MVKVAKLELKPVVAPPISIQERLQQLHKVTLISDIALIWLALNGFARLNAFINLFSMNAYICRSRNTYSDLLTFNT